MMTKILKDMNCKTSFKTKNSRTKRHFNKFKIYFYFVFKYFILEIYLLFKYF